MAASSSSVASTSAHSPELALDALLDQLSVQDVDAPDTVDSDFDWAGAASQLQRCADSLRSEEARTKWGQHNDGRLIALCGLLLEHTHLQAQTQCCRVVGNIVLDHPANRRRCLDARVPQRISAFLQSLPVDTDDEDEASLQATKAAIGALLNLTIDTPEIRQVLIAENAADTVARRLQIYRVGDWSDSHTGLVRALIAEWAAKFLTELIQSDDTMSGPVALYLAESVVSFPLPSSSSSRSSDAASPEHPNAHLLLSLDLSILSLSCDLLDPHAYSDPEVQLALASATQPLLGRLLDFVEYAEELPAWKPLIDAERRRAGHGHGQSALDSGSSDDEEEESLEIEKTFANIKGGVARLVIGVCSNDAVGQRAFMQQPQAQAGGGEGDSLAWLTKRAVGWLDGEERADLVIAGATMLANLARTEAHCVSLLQDYSLSSPLSRLLRSYAFPAPHSATRARPGEATQVLHGLLGLLKNLSIPAANKQTLHDADVIPACLHVLREGMDVAVPVQTGAIGALKHLCAGNVASALACVLPPPSSGSSVVVVVDASTAGPGPLDAIVGLAQRTNDIRLKCEATRLLGNIVRSLYSSRSLASPVTPSALNGLETGLAKARARQILESHRGTADALAEMLRTGEKYPVLVNEAVVALTLLSTTEKGASIVLAAITEQHAVPTADGAQGTSSAITGEAEAEGGPATSEGERRPNGHRAMPPTRSSSLGSRVPPASALDILLRWLTEYAIASPAMPAEMAGNALSLVEAAYRTHSSGGKRAKEVKSALSGVMAREVDGENAAELAVRNMAERALAAPAFVEP